LVEKITKISYKELSPESWRYRSGRKGKEYLRKK